MKRVWIWALPAVFGMFLSSAALAAAEEGTWTMTLGCAHCNYEKDTNATSCAPAAKVGDQVYSLKGDAIKDVKFKEGGEYKVTGKLDKEAKSIEVTKIEKAA